MFKAWYTHFFGPVETEMEERGPGWEDAEDPELDKTSER